MEEKNNNLWLYEKYKDVPSDALKPFNNGSFKGTEIKSMWRIKALTETFGPCGFGWYYDIVRTWTEEGVSNEILCFAEIKLYVKHDGEWSKGISATGGSKLVKWYSSKAYNDNSDEGYKMALTDAFGVACKYLGIGASVYWAKEKGKYTEGDEDDKKGKNGGKSSNTPKISEKKKDGEEPKKTGKIEFKPISRAEMVQEYGVKNVEETIAWFEEKLQVPYAEWDEECDEIVRTKLAQKKAKREQDEWRRQELLGHMDDVPFPLGERK